MRRQTGLPRGAVVAVGHGAATAIVRPPHPSASTLNFLNVLDDIICRVVIPRFHDIVQTLLGGHDIVQTLLGGQCSPIYRRKSHSGPVSHRDSTRARAVSVCRACTPSCAWSRAGTHTRPPSGPSSRDSCWARPHKHDLEPTHAKNRIADTIMSISC